MYNESKDAAGNYPIRLIPKGTFFRLVSPDGTPKKRVYIRGEYDRSTKRYECSEAEDINASITPSGKRIVNVGFDY